MKLSLQDVVKRQFSSLKAKMILKEEVFDGLYELCQFCLQNGLNDDYHDVVKFMASEMKFKKPIFKEQNTQLETQPKEIIKDSQKSKSIDTDDEFAIQGLQKQKKQLTFLSAKDALNDDQNTNLNVKGQIQKVIQQQQEVNSKPQIPSKVTDEDNDEKKNKYIQTLLDDGAIMKIDNLNLDSIHGMSDVKQLLTDSIITPLLFPELFAGHQSYSRFLLHSLPGCGKSFMVKCLAGQAQLPLVSVSPSQLFSKWQGGSEKLVRAVFDLAAKNKPCILFLDEVDALCSQRSSGDSESSRRVKNEILLQLDSLPQGVTVIAATNLPLEIDSAVRRRFEKRIYIDLADNEARRCIFKEKLPQLDDKIIEMMVNGTDNFSGADCNNIARAVGFIPLQKLQACSKFIRRGNNIHIFDGENGDEILEGKLVSFRQYKPIQPPITQQDVQDTLSKVKSSINLQDISIHKEFSQQFGSI